MGKAVKVVYHVDILTGACVAYVKCGDSVLYSYIGQCASSIPVSGSDWTNMINGIINASTAIGSMAATGGLTAPMAASTIATTAVNTIKPSIERSGFSVRHGWNNGKSSAISDIDTSAAGIAGIAKSIQRLSVFYIVLSGRSGGVYGG